MHWVQIWYLYSTFKYLQGIWQVIMGCFTMFAYCVVFILSLKSFWPEELSKLSSLVSPLNFMQDFPRSLFLIPLFSCSTSVTPHLWNFSKVYHRYLFWWYKTLWSYLWDTRSKMFIVIGNGFGEPSSNSGRGCLNYTLC